MTLRHCFNWKVLAGLGVVAVALLAVSPGLFARLFPVLVVAVCPLSMLGMMWGIGAMRGKRHAESRADGVAPVPPPAGMACCSPPLPVRTRPSARVEELRGQLVSLAAQQELLAGEIAHLETEATDASTLADERVEGARR